MDRPHLSWASVATQLRHPETPSKVPHANVEKLPTNASGLMAEDRDAKQSRKAQGYGPGSGVGA